MFGMNIFHFASEARGTIGYTAKLRDTNTCHGPQQFGRLVILLFLVRSTDNKSQSAK